MICNFGPWLGGRHWHLPGKFPRPGTQNLDVNCTLHWKSRSRGCSPIHGGNAHRPRFLLEASASAEVTLVTLFPETIFKSLWNSLWSIERSLQENPALFLLACHCCKRAPNACFPRMKRSPKGTADRDEPCIRWERIDYKPPFWKWPTSVAVEGKNDERRDDMLVNCMQCNAPTVKDSASFSNDQRGCLVCRIKILKLNCRTY